MKIDVILNLGKMVNLKKTLGKKVLHPFLTFSRPPRVHGNDEQFSYILSFKIYFGGVLHPIPTFRPFFENCSSICLPISFPPFLFVLSCSLQLHQKRGKGKAFPPPPLLLLPNAKAGKRRGGKEERPYLDLSLPFPHLLFFRPPPTSLFPH